MTSWVYNLENFKLNHFFLDCTCVKICVKLYKLWRIKSSLFYGNTYSRLIYIRSSNREKQLQAEELKKYLFPSVQCKNIQETYRWCKMNLGSHQRNVNYLGKELQYMKNTIFIEDRRVSIKLIRSRLEAIQKLRLQKQLKYVEALQEW